MKAKEVHKHLRKDLGGEVMFDDNGNILPDLFIHQHFHFCNFFIRCFSKMRKIKTQMFCVDQ